MEKGLIEQFVDPVLKFLLKRNGCVCDKVYLFLTNLWPIVRQKSIDLCLQKYCRLLHINPPEGEEAWHLTAWLTGQRIAAGEKG
jgi:hypothetical protein